MPDVKIYLGMQFKNIIAFNCPKIAIGKIVTLSLPKGEDGLTNTPYLNLPMKILLMPA